MGIFDDVADFVTAPFKVGKDIVGGVASGAKGLYNNLTGETARANAEKIMQEQMKAYREQTELTRKELERTRKETDIQKRRVEEKQIRGLRRNYRPQGLLGVGESGQQGMSETLGG